VEPFFIVLLFGGFVALAVVLGILSYQQQQKRIAELAALAMQIGWQFDPEHDTSHSDRYPQFEIFGRGRSRYAYNTLRGTISINGELCAAQMGDYHYRVTSGSGKNRRTHTYRLSYLIVHLPFARLPNLFIRRENIFDSMAGAFGFDDIDFESAEFSKRFHVKSDDKRFAYDVIHPKMIDFLLANQSPSVDIEEGRCCVSDGSGTWTAEEFRTNVDWAGRFFALWPNHLVAALKSV
jgi:hypothetical protein